jgi:antitoxin MazE
MQQLAIAKWGNSLALRLPRHVLSDVNLTEGSTVDICVRDGSVVVTPVRKKYRLADLLAQMTENSQRAETEWGSAQGEEAW